MASEANLETLNADYPCDQRIGYGFKGCKCGEKGHGEEDRGYIECNIFSPQIKWLQCIQCPYQKNYIKKNP